MSDESVVQGSVCLDGHMSTGTPMRRRRFLGRLGAAGLVVATGTFGRTAKAEASGGCSCCNLKFCPANVSYSICSTAACHYIWGCAGTGTTTCNCCEMPAACGEAYAYSAYQCFVH
jgi:hypothetical protein